MESQATRQIIETGNSQIIFGMEELSNQYIFKNEEIESLVEDCTEKVINKVVSCEEKFKTETTELLRTRDMEKLQSEFLVTSKK